MDVKIYSRDDCPYCVKAKNYFSRKNITYQEYKVGADLTREEYYSTTGMKTVPAIYIDDKLIGGFNDLVDYAVDNPEVFDGR
jgi:thioredoxin reductase (NADPH)